jgi:GT2 family glycosyltransferase
MKAKLPVNAQGESLLSLDTFPSVLIIIVNWNGKDFIFNCLDSLLIQHYPLEKYEIVVIDNGSTDGSQTAIKDRYINVQLVENPENFGYVKAVNQGIRIGLKSGVQYMWILNNDVVVSQNTLQRLVEIGEHLKSSGILAPVVYAYDSPEHIENAGYKINFWIGRLKKLRFGVDIFRLPISRIDDVDSNMGCANLIKTSIFEKIGLFNPIYEIYFEETDFNTRARKNGFRVILVRDAKVWHKTASSMNRRILRRAFLLLRNLCIFEFFHAKPFQLLVFFPYFLFIHTPYFLLYGCFLAYKIKRKNNRKSNEIDS